MKITRSSEAASEIKRNKEIANTGCDVCPCCGESRGVRNYHQRTWATLGFFKMKFMKCDCYVCWLCEAEWESDPYEW